MSREVLLFVRRSGLFLLGLVLILTGIELRLRANLDSPERRHFEELFHTQHSADVIIIGSSTAVHGINPLYLEGIKTSAADFSRIYNFALRGAQMNFWKQWYDVLFARQYPTPSLAIVSVDWFGFAGDNRVGGIEYYSRYFPFNVFLKLLWNRAVPDKVALWMNRFYVFQARRDIIHVFFPRMDFGQLRMDQYYKGYVPLDRTIDTRKPPAVKAASWDNSLEQLLDDLLARHVRIVLIQTPNYIPGRVMQGKDTNALLAKLARAKGIPLLNYNTEKASALNFNPDYYADYAHMNEAGSRAFSLLLKADLEKLLR